jgi:cytochrome c oxidase assembly protein subunit 15
MFKNEKYHNLFSIWLVGLIILLAMIIVVGGLTRLTESGLSITKWEIFKGILPPLNQLQWEKYFLEYKSIPQYILLNSSMSLQEFKFIFLWEYFHRLLGRIIGLFFIIPFIFFLYKKTLDKYLTSRLITILILILVQGSIGLFIAFIIFSSLCWIFMNHHYQKNKFFFNIDTNFLSLKTLLFLIFFQIVIGAFVSGLDAGKIYQTWPLMNESYFPNDNFLANLFNFKDPSFVQFFHRNIAYIIFILSVYSGIAIYKNKAKELYFPYLFFESFILFQILLGVFVLYSNVNIYFASLHQISSIFLIVSSLNLYYRSIRTK